MRFAKPLITVVICSAAQVCALAAGHALWSSGASLVLAVTGACCVGIALSLIARARLEIVLLNGVFPIAVLATFGGEATTVDGGWLLPVAALMLLLFAPTVYSGVPYYPTHRKVYEAIRKLLPANQPFEFVDLGCGDGRLLAYLARHFPQARLRGCELSPLAWIFAVVRCFPYRSRVRIEFADMWRFDVAHADVIYNFLAPPVMARLWMKLSTEAKPGALLVSNAFPLPVIATDTISFAGDRRSTLYVYGAGSSTPKGTLVSNSG